MAACGTLQQIFDNPLAASPCKHNIPMSLLDDSPVDVLSGLLNLNEITDSNINILSPDHTFETERHESIVKQTRTKIPVKPKIRSRNNIIGREMPPPISSLGKRVCFKSYRHNGRLVIKAENILTQNILHAYREDGRLMLRFVRFDDDIEA